MLIILINNFFTLVSHETNFFELLISQSLMQLRLAGSSLQINLYVYLPYKDPDSLVDAHNTE